MAEKKKITRKIITPVKPVAKSKPTGKVEQPQEDVVSTEVEEKAVRTTKSKKVCYFCQSKTNPSYTDLANLRRFLTDRAKIVAKERSGVCARHQRQVAKNIKYARHLSLLPFVPKV